eukprot:6195022-Pleurochrysis_carterae.AAC.4
MAATHARAEDLPAARACCADEMTRVTHGHHSMNDQSFIYGYIYHQYDLNWETVQKMHTNEIADEATILDVSSQCRMRSLLRLGNVGITLGILVFLVNDWLRFVPMLL